MEAASDVRRRRRVIPERAGLGRTEDVLEACSRFDGACVSPGTPSMAFGTRTPCQ